MIVHDSLNARTRSTNDKNWLVLVTKPNHEKSLFRSLTEGGIHVLLPLITEVRQWSDRKKKFAIPYFPNYLFVNISMIDRYRVFDSPGAVRYLDSNYNPSVLSDKDMSIIKKLDAGDAHAEVTSAFFEKGDLVMITSGAFRDHTAVLIEKKGNKRLLISLESIHRSLLLDVAAYSIYKVPTTQSPSLVQGRIAQSQISI